MGGDRGARPRYPLGVGANYKLVLHIFQLKKADWLEKRREENILVVFLYSLTPSPFHSFEISFRVKVFPLLSAGTLN